MFLISRYNSTSNVTKALPDLNVAGKIGQWTDTAYSVFNAINPLGTLDVHNQTIRARTKSLAVIKVFRDQHILRVRALLREKKMNTPQGEILMRRLGLFEKRIKELQDEINYISRDAKLQRVKKMGLPANLMIPGTGRIVGLGALAAKTAHVAYFTVNSKCSSDVKVQKVKEIAKQWAFELTKIAALTAIGYSIYYSRTFFR